MGQRRITFHTFAGRRFRILRLAQRYLASPNCKKDFLTSLALFLPTHSIRNWDLVFLLGLEDPTWPLPRQLKSQLDLHRWRQVARSNAQGLEFRREKDAVRLDAQFGRQHREHSLDHDMVIDDGSGASVNVYADYTNFAAGQMGGYDSHSNGLDGYGYPNQMYNSGSTNGGPGQFIWPTEHTRYNGSGDGDINDHL